MIKLCFTVCLRAAKNLAKILRIQLARLLSIHLFIVNLFILIWHRLHWYMAHFISFNRLTSLFMKLNLVERTDNLRMMECCTLVSLIVSKVRLCFRVRKYDGIIKSITLHNICFGVVLAEYALSKRHWIYSVLWVHTMHI